MLKTRVAHGYCSRHESRGACPYANICETCDNYTPATEFEPALTGQLADIQALQTDAEHRGWTSEEGRNRHVADHPQRITRPIYTTPRDSPRRSFSRSRLSLKRPVT